DWRRAAVWIESDVASPESPMLRQWCSSIAAVATAPDSNRLARAKVMLGIWRAERNELDAALPLLLDAVRLAPDDADALRTAAVAMARAGRYAEALELLQRPAARDSFQAERELCRKMARVSTDLAHGGTQDLDALFELGRTAFEANRYDAAAAAFVALLDVDPAHRLALAYLGEMQVRCKMRIVDQVLVPRALRVARP